VDPTAPYGRDAATGEPLSNKNGVVAGCLQLFFGVLGIGRWYLGDSKVALLQLGGWAFAWVTLIFSFIWAAADVKFLAGLCLVAFWPMVFGVVGWVWFDGIRMLTGHAKDAHGRKLR